VRWRHLHRVLVVLLQRLSDKRQLLMLAPEVLLGIAATQTPVVDDLRFRNFEGNRFRELLASVGNLRFLEGLVECRHVVGCGC
jgi:hypothetical protein